MAKLRQVRHAVPSRAGIGGGWWCFSGVLANMEARSSSNSSSNSSSSSSCSISTGGVEFSPKFAYIT